MFNHQIATNYIKQPYMEVINMNWKVLFAVLAVMMLVGCAAPVAEEPEPVVEEPEPIVEEIVEEPEPIVEEPKPSTEEVVLQDNYAEPTDLTVLAGSTVVFKNMGTKVKIMQVKKPEFNERSPRLNEGDSWEITLMESGEYQFLDIIIGRAKGTITVE